MHATSPRQGRRGHLTAARGILALIGIVVLAGAVYTVIEREASALLFLACAPFLLAAVLPTAKLERAVDGIVAVLTRSPTGESPVTETAPLKAEPSRKLAPNPEPPAPAVAVAGSPQRADALIADIKDATSIEEQLEALHVIIDKWPELEGASQRRLRDIAGQAKPLDGTDAQKRKFEAAAMCIEGLRPS